MFGPTSRAGMAHDVCFPCSVRCIILCYGIVAVDTPARYGDDIVVQWDPDDAATDIFLTAVMTITSARVTELRTTH